MSLERIVSLVDLQKVEAYGRYRLELLELPFKDIFDVIADLLRNNLSWKLPVAVEAIDETTSQPNRNDLEGISRLCSSFPLIQFTIRRRLTTFLETMPTADLIEWYETLSINVYQFNWLKQELLEVLTSRIQAVKDVDSETWFEELARKVLQDKLLPDLAPVVESHCLKLAFAFSIKKKMASRTH
jgi:hypothetical protein